MTHFVGLVVAEDESEISELLEQFDEGQEVDEYFSELDADSRARLAEEYNIDVTDNEAVCHKVRDWTNSPGVIQDGKVGYMTTYNPDSKWDWYEIGGRWRGEVPGNQCVAEDVKTYFTDYTPAVLVDADGWHASKNYGWWGFSEEIGDPTIVAQKIVDHYGKNVFVIDFHGA